MKSKRTISSLFTALFLIAFVWYGFTNQEIFQGFSDVNIAFIILIAIGKLIVIGANGILIKLTAEVFIKKVNAGEGVYISILSAIGNFLGPLLGGAGIRAIYLKKYHNLSYGKFTSTLLGYYLIMLSVNCIAAIIALINLPSTKQTNTLITFFSLWLLILIVLMFFKAPNKLPFKNSTNKYITRIRKIFKDVIDGWHLIVHDRKLVLRLTTLAIVSYFGTYLVSYMGFQALDINISLFGLALYSSLITLSVLLSITPGAIGIRETIFILVGVTLGLSNSDIIQVAILDRGVHFLLLLFLFGITRLGSFKRLMTGRNVEV